MAKFTFPVQLKGMVDPSYILFLNTGINTGVKIQKLQKHFAIIAAAFFTRYNLLNSM